MLSPMEDQNLTRRGSQLTVPSSFGYLQSSVTICVITTPKQYHRIANSTSVHRRELIVLMMEKMIVRRAPM